MAVGRFAPSPTGRLHLGNLRTALVAWLAARAPQRGHRQGPTTTNTFLLRFEDLDTAAVRPEHYHSQRHDLSAIGLDWDGTVIRQSDRLADYDRAVARLTDADLLYPCFCSRKEIREAASAPNLAHAGHHYPGTCRELSSAQRSQRGRTRDPALRLRAGAAVRTFDDLVMGRHRFEIDDFVIKRNDGTPAYHLAVVIDDAAQGVDLVVRADDLLESTSRQLLLYELFDLPPPRYGHVPLVLASNGDRLAKRHGAVTLEDRADRGESPAQVITFLASTLGLFPAEAAAAGETTSPTKLLDRFEFQQLPRQPLTLPAHYLTGSGR